MSNKIKIDNALAHWAIRAIQDLERTREIYEGDADGIARLILHLRDLKHPLVSVGLTASQSSLVSAEIRRTALSYKSFLPSATLLFEKVRREIYRFTGV
jgi:hypothetical protein